ncbi:dihydropteroate synthase [Microvirga sp. W0021]|uniref:Dihydropteroate synthase n=1 Tax=Hohaiivirga grylli TaxID=3133970 RepID=A0ABV0BHI7_9HYPH
MSQSRLKTLLPDIEKRVLVMGILNVTPDSFSDGGLHDSILAAEAHARLMIEQEVDIIDIGGESTRPGFSPISAEEEIRRIEPIISRIAQITDKPISIDTYKSETARTALKAGAHIINDVCGLQHDPVIADVAAEFGAPVIIMHNRAEEDPDLDILDDMRYFFDRSLSIAYKAGIAEHNIILDPGIGFGKTDKQHFEIIQRLPELRAFGFPMLVGASRKRMIAKIVNRPPQERMAGTLAVHTLAAINGASIIRAHDVAEHVDAMRVTDTYKCFANESAQE